MRVLSESWPSTTGSPSPSTGEPRIPTVSAVPSGSVWRTIQPADVESEFEDIDEVVAESERDGARRAHIERARRAIAGEFSPETLGLAALRLKLGWSQKRLAEQIGTSQPHIARIEMGDEDIRMSTARRLAHALGVSIGEIDAAIGARQTE
jgi:ribosome-binding protein aMBF1 (putative translation factor)